MGPLSYNSMYNELASILQLLRSNLQKYKIESLPTNKALVPRLGPTDLEYPRHTLHNLKFL